MFCLCTITGTQGAAERGPFALQTFADARTHTYEQAQTFNGQSRARARFAPNPNADISLVRRGHVCAESAINPNLCNTKEQAKYCTPAPRSNVCFMHYTLSTSNLLQLGEIMSIPAALFLLVLNFSWRNRNSLQTLLIVLPSNKHCRQRKRRQLLYVVHLCQTPHFYQSINKSP